MSRHLEILLGEITEPFRSGFHMDDRCDNRESELDEMLEHVENAEMLIGRIAVMMRTIADLRSRERLARTRERKLEEALRKLVKYPPPPDTSIDSPAFRTMNEMRGLAVEALEEEIPF